MSTQHEQSCDPAREAYTYGRPLVDDQPSVRRGPRMRLEPDLKVVRRSGRRRRGGHASPARPEVILMDVRMPGMDGTRPPRRCARS